MRSSIIPPFLCFALYFSAALSFSVTIGSSPTQCGPLSITWTGGQAPFQITLTPVFDVPTNVSVPSSAFNNNEGSYQISSIPFNKGTQFLVTMSDVTGFGTGGTSDLLTVGAPVGGASCNTSSGSLPFSFSLPSSLQQCSSYIFDQYDGATLPVTIAGLIPGGETFLLYPPATGTSFTWSAVDVAAGTTIVFTMSDAQGRSGGSSDIEMVALSNDASCLNARSPSSTISAVPSSTSAVSSSTPSPTQTSSAPSSGTIAGAVIGAILAVAAVAGLTAFCLKHRCYRRSPYGLTSPRNSRRPNSVELDPGVDNFQHPPIYPFPYQTDSVSRLAPPVVPSLSSISVSRPVPPITPGSPSMSTSYVETSSLGPFISPSERSSTQQFTQTNSRIDSFAAFGDVASSSMSSSGRRKAAMAGATSYQPVTRFIVHTDAEDHPSEDEVEVVELPPQYSERRPPVPNSTGTRTLSEVDSEQRADEVPQSPPAE